MVGTLDGLGSRRSRQIECALVDTGVESWTCWLRLFSSLCVVRRWESTSCHGWPPRSDAWIRPSPTISRLFGLCPVRSTAGRPPRKRFARAFFPAFGPDPYRELRGHHSKLQFERGHQLASHQDAWLGELIAEPERDGPIDHTMIVFTADHRMRVLTVQDGARVALLRHGKGRDVTMPVPMLEYVPGVVPQPVAINCPTSHIDRTPTLLELLGISTGADLGQGSSLFDPGIENRCLLRAMNFFGAFRDYDLESYYSLGSQGGGVQESSLNFTDKGALRFDDKGAPNAHAVVAEQDASQRVILSNVLNGEDH